ncbi:GAF domain-containing protein [Mycolicibacterium aichiense]|uniref:Gp84-like domain-containing protein n=1 Tax=Mycolicibacterium aichiense TaxID=1799 RepID=A0AAD1HQQ0_9MYCO|nr:GAF domain-containing protein [Mycolicibacterium aichiense]MCV7016743.1 GAF domain-containing protein [Mycolicibacterium aichiense]QFG08049.1 hypothetical protein SEA_HERBERTWM_83 [Mycobacterium phage Herbertwm]BBX09475.1 hypothetical protein MAIC_42780 [Mycolicibacterium aichiense]SUA14040.1 Uncharacterised protein [Mycolicibacterium aichiense]
MLTLTVQKYGSTKKATAKANAPRILTDHLEAATRRAGDRFEMSAHILSADSKLPFGQIFRDGKPVASWGIS